MKYKEIKILSWLCHFFLKQAELYRMRKKCEYYKTYNIDFSKVQNVEIFHIENVFIGKGSYINSGQLHAGPNSKITIGKNCDIGYNVHIKSYTHNPLNPTGEKKDMIDKDIIIGDNVWIGDNVYIKEGITIGNNIIIGANSVVTKSFDSGSIIGGCPAKLLSNKIVPSL